jgi:hypothetical protein
MMNAKYPNIVKFICPDKGEVCVIAVINNKNEFKT